MYKSLDSFKVESMTELLFESDIHVRIALASMLLSTVDERIEMREFDEGHMMDLLSLVKKACPEIISYWVHNNFAVSPFLERV